MLFTLACTRQAAHVECERNIEVSLNCFFGLSGERIVDIQTGDTKRAEKQLSNCGAKGAALFSCLRGTGSHASFVCCAGSAWLTEMYGRDLSVSHRGVARATDPIRAITTWIRTRAFAQQSNGMHAVRFQ